MHVTQSGSIHVLAAVYAALHKTGRLRRFGGAVPENVALHVWVDPAIPIQPHQLAGLNLLNSSQPVRSLLPSKSVDLERS